jgi:hypothetical protein
MSLLHHDLRGVSIPVPSMVKVMRNCGVFLGLYRLGGYFVQLPATTLRDAVLSHPTMVEGFNALFAAL